MKKSFLKMFVRKLCLGLILIAAGLFGRAAHGQSAVSNAIQSLGPIAYWPLQETVQPPAANIEPNNGSLGSIANMYYSTNSLTILPLVQGPMGNAARWFTANAAGYALVPTTDNRVSLRPGGPFTVELWINPQNYGNFDGIVEQTGPIPGGGNNGLFYKAGWVIGQNYYPAVDDGSGTYSGASEGWTFTVFNGQNMYAGANCMAPYEYATNIWYHLVGVFDGTNCSLYVDGLPASFASESDAMPAGTAFLPDTWDPLEVGTSRGIGANAVNEQFSEFLIYTNALSASTISNHYYQGTVNGYSAWQTAVTGNNPYMYYYMSASGYFPPNPNTYPLATNYGSAVSVTTNLTLLNADSFLQNNGIYQPGTVPGLAGPQYSGFGTPSYACAFNALGGAVDAGYTPAMNPTGSNTAETAIGWYKCNPCDDNGRFNSIVSHTDSSWRMKIHNGTNIWDSGGGPDLSGPSVSNLNVNDGNWHMFAGVYTPYVSGTTPSTNLLYVDGFLVASVVGSNYITGSTTQDVWIGGAPDHIGTSGGAQQFFAGYIAHVAYYTNVLTAGQIQYLYSAGGLPPNIIGQPASYTTTQSGGGTATFSVTATAATNNLFYQWYFVSGGVTNQLAGQNATNLVLTPLADNQSGSYFVVITNNYGAVTSTLAGLSVSSEPMILSQSPGSTLTLYAGQGTNLSVTAVGSNITYQWYTNSVADTVNGTTSAYALSGVTTAMSGYTYQCTISDGVYPSVSSQTTTLTVLPLPASLTAGGTFGSNVMALGPTSYWPMHETAAGLAGDVETNLGTLGSLGNAFYADWDPNDAPIIYMTRQVPGPLTGDFATDLKRTPCSFLTISHQSPSTTIKPPFSVETWVYPSDVTATPQVIIGQGGGTALSGTGNEGGFALQWGNSGGKSNCFSVAIWTGSGSGNDELSTPVVYAENRWYHLVSTFDGTNITIYINGQPSSSYIAGTTNTTMNPDFWDPLVVGGGRWTTTGPADPYQGLIAEPAIYSNVLTAAAVQKHYQDGITLGAAAYYNDVTNGNPLLYYRMTAPNYTQPPRSAWPVVTNYGSVAGNGVYTPSVIPGSLGGLPLANVGSTVSTPLNGNGGFADLGMNSSLNPLGYTSFSYMAFFKAYPLDLNFASIMSGNDETWRSEINAAGKVQAHGNADITSSNQYNDGNWHLMVLTAQANATAGNFTNLLYIDGALAGNIIQAANTGTNNPFAGDPGPEALIGNEDGFWPMSDGIPNPPNGGGTGQQGEERCFAGSICEAAFFNGQVLTAAQVSSLYAAAGVPPFFGISTNSIYAPYYANKPYFTNVNEGANFVFTNFGTASGSGGSFTYLWYSNGVAMPGETAAALTLNPVQANSGATYYLVASNAFGTGNSPQLVVTVAALPQIVSASPSATNVLILAQSTLDFSVVTSGKNPLSYLWYSNGVQVVDATNSFIIPSVSNYNAGTYSVIVSNSLGTVTNIWTVAVVNVTGPFVPYVLNNLHPIGFWLMNEPGDGVDATNQGVCHDYVGGNNGQYVNAVTGVEPSYNWADAFTDNYDTNTAAGFGPGGGTGYGNLVNSCALNISNIVVSTPNNGEFSVQCWAQAPFGTIPSSINTPSLVAKGLYNHEEFALDLGNHLGGIGNNSDTAYRFETRNAAETTFNANSSVVAGSDTNWHFVVGVCDQANGFLYIYIDGTNAGQVTIAPGAGIDNASDSVPVMIGSRTSTTYSTSTMNEQFNGNIADVAIFNYALTPAQVLAEYLVAGVAPNFSVQPPATTNVDECGPLTLTAVAVGTLPLSYQWWDVNANAPIIGATGTNLTLASVCTGDSYYCVVTNLYGTNYSVTNSTTVVYAPVVEVPLTPSNSVTYVVGSSVTLSAVIDGDVPLTNGWQLNGNAIVNTSRISGATGQTLAINPLQLGDSGTYQLFATNSAGNTSTLPTTVTVVSNLNFFGATGTGWQTQGTAAGLSETVFQGNNTIQLTFDKGNESNSVFYIAPMNITAFEASFEYQITTAGSLADGVTFCIQNDPRGTEALGPGGGGLGYGGGSPDITPSVAFEINIYSGNANGGVGVAIDTNGNIGPNLATTPLNFVTGDLISNYVYYNGSTMTVTMTDASAGTSFTTSAALNIPAILGTNLAYVGFTGADGGSEASQQISNFAFESLGPPLIATRSGGNITLSWSPDGIGNYNLYQANVLGKPTSWTPVATTPTFVNNMYQVTVPASGSAQYYSLILQVPGNF